MNVHVMGGAGRLGRRVVDRLLASAEPGERVAACVRAPEKASGAATRGAEVRKADYDDPATMREAFEGADVLVLIPTFAPVEERILQHAAALTAAKDAGVGRVVFTGFQAASIESRFIVAPFMIYAECKLRQSGLDWTILRNGLYADPLVDYAPEIAETGRIPYPAGEGRAAYICRDDLAAAAAAACRRPESAGRTYELTGREAVSIAELAGILTRVTGSPVRYEPASDHEFERMCEAPDIPAYVPRALVTLYHAVAAGEFERVTDHVETLTGRPPERLETYLARHLKRSA